jgi:hypothetical protein
METSFSTQSTRWSLVVRARGEGKEARVAMGELVRRYERTILCHVRRYGCPPGTTPEDEKQAFLTAVIGRNDLGRLDPAKGRFRDWLSVSVRNHMHNTRKRWLTDMRGNLVTDQPGDFEVARPATQEDDCLTAEALDVCDVALRQHREEARRKDRFDALSCFLPGRTLDPAELGPLSSSLGLTKNALSVAIYHMQARHKQIVHELVADTLHIDCDGRDPWTIAAVRDEIRELYAALRRIPAAQLRRQESEQPRL